MTLSSAYRWASDYTHDSFSCSSAPISLQQRMSTLRFKSTRSSVPRRSIATSSVTATRASGGRSFNGIPENDVHVALGRRAILVPRASLPGSTPCSRRAHAAPVLVRRSSSPATRELLGRGLGPVDCGKLRKGLGDFRPTHSEHRRDASGIRFGRDLTPH
jgi:hypothetical protein